jgi:hypothetical protein
MSALIAISDSFLQPQRSPKILQLKRFSDYHDISSDVEVAEQHAALRVHDSLTTQLPNAFA